MQRHLNHLLGLLAAHHGCRDQRPAGNEEMLLRLTEVNACTSFVIRMLVNMRVVYHFHLLFFFFFCHGWALCCLLTNTLPVGSRWSKCLTDVHITCGEMSSLYRHTEVTEMTWNQKQSSLFIKMPVKRLHSFPLIDSGVHNSVQSM